MSEKTITDRTTPDPRIERMLNDWFEGDPADYEQPGALMRKWFAATLEEDHALGQRLGSLAAEAVTGDLASWPASPRGRLALIILLDQLPRSLHRGTPGAFAGDPAALELCLDGLDRREHEALHPLERVFFCMPLQHAESREIQARSAIVFTALAESVTDEPLASVLQKTLAFALEHKAIVDRFGRFPHRNRTLGRESTVAELEFIQSGGPSFGQ